MFLNCLFFTFIAVTAFIVIAFVLLFFHVMTDEFDMGCAMRKFKEACCKYDSALRELGNIIKNMNNCPTISNNIKPIEVYRDYDLYGFIVGNSKGEPRFFAFSNDTEIGNMYDVNEMVKTSKSFKKQGLKHSVGVEELKAIFEEASKANFKDKIEREQERKIYKHFNK